MASLGLVSSYDEYSFAKWVAKATQKYFENPDVQKRFKEWQHKKEGETNDKM